jgi:N-acetylmuramoyl-L-alanine amidase
MFKTKFKNIFLKDSIKYASYEKFIELKEFEKLNLSDIIQVDFPDNQYIRAKTKKNQIVLHHTVSGLGVTGDIAWWRKTKARIGTAIIIGWDGKIYQCFSSKYWAYHLGIKDWRNKKLNQGSIGIEIDSWGGLVQHSDGKYYPAKWSSMYKKFVPNLKAGEVKNVQKYDKKYRGFYAFEKYTDAQIEAVRKLLMYWNEHYGIPLTYNEDMWEYNKDALNGKSGVWGHVSFRKDKSDVHPDDGLVKMLKELATWENRRKNF